MGSIGSEEAMQALMDRQERIHVSVRVRPLNEKEVSRNDFSEWECINDNTIMHRSSIPASDRSLYPTTYTFDRVFRPGYSTRLVYEEAAKEVALSVVSGINSSIFAYGQTSSGKTYTMGGVTRFTVEDIYYYIQMHKEREFVLKFSAIEIYNESVKDLLSADGTPRRLLDDPERGTVVERLTEEILKDWGHFCELISFCDAQRQIGETSLNEFSSRSHQILRLTVESSAREFLGNDKSSSLAASVNFVDLAGSERASQTNSAGSRLKEATHINRSLLTLGTVIRKLSKGRNGHIPFRDSKLTRILQSSLGGNARTAIICTMSPARSHVEQTRNTLLFASCAKEVATSAQVNVVVSDKALVKQLQRELARLETELRNSSLGCRKSDSAALLREKDIQIEKLKKEVLELSLQRDQAQTRIRDMLQVVGNDLSAIESGNLHPQYPKLRIRSSFDFEPQMSETPDFSNLECLESVRSFDASQYSDGHSISSDENPFPLADFEKNFPERISSSQISVTDHDDAENDLNQEHIKERYDNSLVDLCEEVRCIASEDVATDRYAGSNMPDLSPNLYTGSNASSPRASSTSCVAKVVNTERENQNLGSSWLKEDKGLNNFNKVVVPSPEKVSPWLPESSTSSIRSLRLARSRSCKASLMMNASPYWFEKEEFTESTPIEKVFTRRPDGSRININALNYNFIPDRLSWNGPESSAGCSAIDELEVQNNVKTSIDMESDSNDTLASARNEKADLGSINQLVEHKVDEIGLEPANSFKRLHQMQFDGKTSSDWLSEFKRLQREIIELWHACNVPLVHRTYFFLLFKGDPSDSIYMEVERRRLSFLKQTFSEGNQTLEDGRIITPASSMKHLRRERQMLCRKMQKRLSKAERENLYLKWGIRLSSKDRGLQLAHSLWTKTEDMDHIRESAALVAKLVGPVEPQEAFREMFGLNFAPRRTSSRRSFGWSVTRKNILRG